MNNQSKSKMVIIIRKDLKMNKGKIAAQVGHAVLNCILSQGKYAENKSIYKESKDFVLRIDPNQSIKDWLEGDYTKIVLGVNSEEELLTYKKIAEEENMPCALITDNGYTTFSGEKTNTCLAIGPAWNEEIDSICKDLKLF